MYLFYVNREDTAACFNCVVFWMSCRCCRSSTLPRGAMGWSVVCDWHLVILTYKRMAENEFAPPPPREFRRHNLSCRELKAESFKKCLFSVRWSVNL